MDEVHSGGRGERRLGELVCFSECLTPSLWLPLTVIVLDPILDPVGNMLIEGQERSMVRNRLTPRTQYWGSLYPRYSPVSFIRAR